MMTATAPNELIESFLAEAWETTGELETASLLIGEADGLHRLVIASHRLKGSAGLYQFPEVSSLAGLLERVFEGANGFNAQQRDLALDFCAQTTAVISEALERIQSGQDEGEPGLALAALGGPELLTELLRSTPDSFRRSEAQLETSEGMVEEDEALTADPFNVDPAVAITAEMREFFRTQAETWEYFAPEVLENLELVSHGLDRLSQDDPKEGINEMFRGFHTVKGASYSVGCAPLGKLAHRLEDALVLVRDGGKAWTDQFGVAVAQGLDALAKMVTTAEGRDIGLSASLETVHKALDVILGQRTQAEIAPPAAVAAPAKSAASAPTTTPNETEVGASIRVGVGRLERVLNLSGEVLLTRARIDQLSSRLGDLNELFIGSRTRLERTSAEIAERFGNPKFRIEEASNEIDAAVNLLRPESETAVPEQSDNRVIQDVQAMFSELEFDRYDDLSLMARGVAELTADIGELQEQIGDLGRDLRRENESFEKLTRSLRLEAGRLRLVPLSRLYQRLRRQVRSTAQAIGKNVRLELIGENVEIDNIVLENLVDPFIHLVNNAVIHGIEEADIRVKKGKSEEGLIRITAARRSGNLVLEVQDDGAGIDIERVKQKTLERGLRSQAEIDALGDELAAELILLPGLSTADAVSDRAGRGVGMDVVANNIRRLKGSMGIQTELGYGTRFSLRIPASMIVSDILSVEIGGEVYAIPAETVRSLRSVDVKDVRQSGDDRFVDIQGEIFPLTRLSDLLELPRIDSGKRLSVMVLESEAGRFAYEVDRMLGLEQAVVRQLDAPFDGIAHLSGASVNANGAVVLLLDAGGLARLELGAVNAPSTTKVTRRARILLVDDSLSVRKVVSSLISRLGCDVQTASDGEEALEVLNTSELDFDAVITDLEMPRKSGFELLDEMRRRPAFAKLPVAMLTTRASDKHREFALALGVNEYFSKPIDETRLDRFLSRVKADIATKDTASAGGGAA
jgi:chemosensory pili system protein ChpA (sensor histidine kinase/response regulator)